MASTSNGQEGSFRLARLDEAVLRKIHGCVRDEFIYHQRAQNEGCSIHNFANSCVAKLTGKGHVWPTKVLGPSLFSFGEVTFRQKCEKLLGVGNRKRAASDARSRCQALLHEHTDLFMPLGDISLIAFFGSQGRVENAGRVAALQRASDSRKRKHNSRGGHDRPSGKRSLSPSSASPPSSKRSSRPDTPVEGASARARSAAPSRSFPPCSSPSLQRPEEPPRERGPSPVGRTSSPQAFEERMPSPTPMGVEELARRQSRPPSRLGVVADVSVLPGQRPLGGSHLQPQEKSANSLLGLVRYGRGNSGQLPLMASLTARHLVVAARVPINKVPVALATSYIGLTLKVPTERETISDSFVVEAIQNLSMLDRQLSAARFRENFDASGRHYGLHLAQDGTIMADGKLGRNAHNMGYGGAFWLEKANRAIMEELASRYTAGGGSIEETARQACYVLEDYGGLVQVTNPEPDEFQVTVTLGLEGAIRSCPSDNASAALGVGESIEEKVGYKVERPGCTTHKFSLLGRKPSEAMSGSLESVTHVHYRNILNKCAYLSRSYTAELSSHWGHYKAIGELKTKFTLVHESLAGKWETTGHSMIQIDLHLEDWKRFATLHAHHLTGWNDQLKEHFTLLQQMLHSVPTMFDFFWHYSFEVSINQLFRWDKACSEICPQSGSGFRMQDMAIKSLTIRHTLLKELPTSKDSKAERDRKVKAFAPRAWTIVQGRSDGLLAAKGAMITSALVAEQLFESTRRHGDAALQTWEDHFKMFTRRPQLLLGGVTDRVFGPYLTALILHRVGVLPSAPDAEQTPKTSDTLNRDADHLENLSDISAALVEALDEIGSEALKAFWEEEGLGDTAEKLANWKQLAGMSYPLRDIDLESELDRMEPDLLFSPRVPVLSAIVPWLRGAIFSCPHSQRWREQKFSVRSHLTETNQSEFLKECMVLYEGTLHEFNLQQLSGEFRVKVDKHAPEGTSTSSVLPNLNSNAKQIVSHPQHLQQLAKVYEGIDGAAFGASRRRAKDAVKHLKERRELEFASFRKQMKEKRARGTSKMTEDPAAAARKEDQRAEVWAGMSDRERKVALESVDASKAALAKANQMKGPGSSTAKARPSEEYAKSKDVVPRFAHGGSLAITRGEVVGSKRAKPS